MTRDDIIRAALEQPEPPWEAQTEAEKLAYCAGWWAAMEAKAKEQPEPRREWQSLSLEAVAKALADAGLQPEDYREDGQILPLVRAIEQALRSKNYG